MKGNNWNWYGVKIIKKLIVKGQAKEELINEKYDDTIQNFEESIVVVKAQSFEHAYKIAEKGATKYEEPYYNIYGQEVFWEIVGAIDCFYIYDNLETNTEIYSCYYKVPKSLSNQEFIENNILKNIEEGCHMGRHL